MNIEREDVKAIASGRVHKERAKFSNGVMLISLILIAIAVLGGYVWWVSLFGVLLVGWDIYVVRHKIKRLTNTLLLEWDKEHRN